MGLLGLRKFIDTNGCTRLLPVPLTAEEAEDQERALRQERDEIMAGARRGTKRRRPDDDDDDDEDVDEEHEEDGEGAGSSTSAVPCVEHVLIDANCIVHACFGRKDTETKSKRELIQDVLERIRVLVTQVVVPRRSLTICLDGPAPIAKLHTQRLRRRKVALMDAGGTGALTSLAITAGSLLLVELENAIAAQFKLNRGKGFLRRYCPVFLYGSTVPGEGEAKISRALTYISSSPANTPQPYPHHHQHHRRGPPAAHPTPLGPYNFNHTVTVIGNDIDLVMTCLGATHYHNITVISPSSLQLISVGDILYRWLRASGATRGETAQLYPPQLPSLRVDFMFLFLLNGGDHYVGAGEVALPLWRRYQAVRAAYPKSTLVAPDLRSVDTVFLADVLQADQYAGDAEEAVGMNLLRAALWALYTTVTGACPDYRFRPPEDSPHLNHLRAAAAGCRRARVPRITLPLAEGTQPLTPLETYVALMPSESTLPASVAQALRQPSHVRLAKTLANSADPGEVADAAVAAVSAAEPFLTNSERYLRQFTAPVQLNVVPPRERLTRHEHHRRLALGPAAAAALEAASAVPIVQRVEPVDERGVPFVRDVYPSSATSLLFVNPFDAAPAAAAAGGEAGAVESPYSSVPQMPGARPAAPAAAKRDEPRQHRSRVPQRRVLFTPEASTAAVPSLEEVAQKEIGTKKYYAADTRGHLSDKHQQQLNRRLLRKEVEGKKRILQAAEREIRRQERAAGRRDDGDDEDFMKELRGFLGEGETVENVMASMAASAKYERNRKKRMRRKLAAAEAAAQAAALKKTKKGKKSTAPTPKAGAARPPPPAKQKKKKNTNDNKNNSNKSSENGKRMKKDNARMT